MRTYGPSALTSRHRDGNMKALELRIKINITVVTVYGYFARLSTCSTCIMPALALSPVLCWSGPLVAIRLPYSFWPAA